MKSECRGIPPCGSHWHMLYHINVHLGIVCLFNMSTEI